MKQKKLRRIDRCECIPGTFVSILHFPSTGRKQRERRGEKESGVIPFEFNTAGRLIDHALLALLSWQISIGIERWWMDKHLKQWARIVVKMTVMKTNGHKCVNECFVYVFPPWNSKWMCALMSGASLSETETCTDSLGNWKLNYLPFQMRINGNINPPTCIHPHKAHVKCLKSS